MDVKGFVNMLSEHTNNLHISRIIMNIPSQGSTFARQSGSSRIANKKENVLMSQDDASTEVKDKFEKTKAENSF